MTPSRIAAHKLRNTLQSILLVGVMSALCAYLAWVLGGETMAWLALAMVLVGYVFSPALSPALVMRMFNAEPLPPDAAPRLHETVRALARRAGLKRPPALYYIPSDVMNAFSTGRPGNAAVALSDGLLRRLSLREVSAVVAHELSHVVNNDTRIMAFADLTSRLTSTFSLLGQMLLLVNLPLLMLSNYHISWLPILVLIFAPTLSALAQLALSRSREYDADLGAAELTGDPDALAAALEKMERFQGHILESMFLPGQRLPDPSLLRTHPPTRERIRRLMELKEEREFKPRQLDPETPPAHGSPLARQPIPPRWHRTGLWY